jgi:flagellar biosynthesis protein
MSARRQAIALEYGSNAAPMVTAKAEDELALEMIAQARSHGVFITQDPALLALLSRLDVDQEVPPELYTAVAVILSWVYWLKGMRPGDEKVDAETVEDAVMAEDDQASL